MPTRPYSRQDFLNEYSFPLEPARDFELDGIPAEHASGHPKDWSVDIEAFDFKAVIGSVSESRHTIYHSALSPDQKLLAISSNKERIAIFDVKTKELRQVLEGTGKILFIPSIDKLSVIEGDVADASGQGKPAYTLISSISYDAERGAVKDNNLILWELDHHGRHLLDDEEPIDSSTFATLAIEAILPELAAKHEVSQDFVATSKLHEQFTKGLEQVAAEHRRRHNTVLDNARLCSVGVEPFNSDGSLFLYHMQDHTTQHGMRPREKLPHIVIHDLSTGEEVHRLGGHTDAIMWSGFSPNDDHIASVSWDGTMRMYSASTGNLEWVTDDTDGQCWSGAFSKDSKHIVWSSTSGWVVQVLDVADGTVLSKFPEEVKNCCQCLAWHPDNERIALCVGGHAYVWRPFDGPGGTVTQHFALVEANQRRSLVSVRNISWMDGGKLLCLEVSDGTKLIYDTQTNAKEVFKRPQGVNSGWVSKGFYGILDQEGDANFYISVDGDGKVRYWRTSVPSGPSWWEKEKDEETPNKIAYPETGKYVKVIMVPKKEKISRDAEQEDWVEKGAGLWTAE